MSDMPDFDNMSPEELMEWMESLAKRQGADEGFTTSASMTVAEVNEDDERLAGMGEYKPYGMSDDDWAKMQEREAAQKAAKLAAKPQASPEPEPVAEVEPEPVAAVADETPDFDNMSPEELMEWMESLAKRQGADEGFTTSASMTVAEVNEDDERLAGMGEYKPYGMSDDDWAKMQEREAAQKAAKLAAKQSEPVVEDEDDEYDDYEAYDDEDDDYIYEDDEEYADLDDDFFDVPEDSEEMIAAMLGVDDGDSEEVLPSFDDILPAASIEEDESPMDWLAGLSAGDNDDVPSLDFGDMGALGDLAGLSEAEEVSDPMAWLAGLSGDNDAPDLSALMGESSDDNEGSLEWMESLAAEEGAQSEELATSASLDIPMPDSIIDDGPGYEDFSFEEATGMVQDVDEVPVRASADDLVLDDPESWLDDLASGVGNEIPDSLFEGGNEIGDDFFDDLDDDDFILDDDEEDVVEFESLADNVKAQMDSGRLGDSPDDIDKFFASAFAKAATRNDVPDYLDSDDDEDEDVGEVEMPVAAEIPDWLQESMTAMPVDDADDDDEIDFSVGKKATAEMMVADLGLDDEIIEAEIPDWLQGGISEDTGIIENDIFAEIDITETQDTWVEAFSKDDSQELEQWYNDAVSNLDGDTEPATAIVTEDVSLQAADLPIESKLDEGSAQTVPAWFDSSSGQSVEVEAVQGDMDWLGEDFEDEDFVATSEADVDMPDWLQDTVDDSVTADADLPDWLAGETDISADEIPDWLRETMEEEESVPDIVSGSFLDDIVTTPEPSVPLPVPVAQSPAPVPVAADSVDAVAYLRSAKDKISANDIDGAMLDYEQIIRANKALGQVEKELQRLSEDKSYKRNPAVNRVLGDVLMRQGKLQEALDTYRKALNML
ncbi:MAG: hypothetical protein WBC91_09795 [Phototrophicaceae bacterium]